MLSRKTVASIAFLAAGLLAAAAPAMAQIELRKSFPKPRKEELKFPAPDDVAAPPEDAIRTASGLAWRLLGEPAGRIERSGFLDMVEVRYTGWTTDGEMFDTTEANQKSRKFRVSGVIPGFEEAVQLLSVGETGRFWVPEELAYDGREDKPIGMLVFDLTLVGIIRGPDRPANLAAPPENALRFDSGVAWVVLAEGKPDQESPDEESTVLVEYSSWTTEGVLLDSTAYREGPRAFTMNLVIEGFRETLGTMVPGERRLVWIPPELTELDGQPVHDGTVVFDLELLSFMSPPQTPVDVSAIPEDAQRSLTGLAWRVLRPGAGDVHPGPGDTVEVLYAGWTRDGLVFDSSYAHARAGRFALDETMPFGWNEALFGMVSGEKRLVWIPEDLAYGGQKNRPKGMLVFEIELLSIEPRQVDEIVGTP
ncbi:MAG: FKBP-type peptidyl-prolyl cis-trans isomerase [Acidobacteria bacterium]|nr:FKBP-type peptidyl-prolyl cis-trans isomerase [Acidobacteriota bacterium]